MEAISGARLVVFGMGTLMFASGLKTGSALRITVGGSLMFAAITGIGS